MRLGLIKPSFYINGAETLPPPLSAEEEQEILESNNKEMQEKLIVHNLRLVVYIARKFDTTVDSIKIKNNLTSNLLSLGQKLII